jgi:hypothetical protein
MRRVESENHLRTCRNSVVLSFLSTCLFCLTFSKSATAMCSGDCGGLNFGQTSTSMVSQDSLLLSVEYSIAANRDIQPEVLKSAFVCEDVIASVELGFPTLATMYGVSMRAGEKDAKCGGKLPFAIRYTDTLVVLSMPVTGGWSPAFNKATKELPSGVAGLISADPSASEALLYRVKLEGDVTLKWSHTFPKVVSITSKLQLVPQAKGKLDNDRAYASIAQRIPQAQQAILRKQLAEALLDKYFVKLAEIARVRGWGNVELKK